MADMLIMNPELMAKFSTALKDFNEEEIETFFGLSPINFQNNVTSDDILEFMDDFSTETHAPAYFMLLHDRDISEEVQEYIVEYFDLNCVNEEIGEDLILKLSDKIIKKALDQETIVFDGLTENLKTNEMFIYAYRNSTEDDWESIYHEDYLCEEFVETNFENPDISVGLAKAMFATASNDVIKTYLVLSHAFDTEDI